MSEAFLDDMSDQGFPEIPQTDNIGAFDTFFGEIKNWAKDKQLKIVFIVDQVNALHTNRQEINNYQRELPGCLRLWKDKFFLMIGSASANNDILNDKFFTVAESFDNYRINDHGYWDEESKMYRIGFTREEYEIWKKEFDFNPGPYDAEVIFTSNLVPLELNDIRRLVSKGQPIEDALRMYREGKRDFIKKSQNVLIHSLGYPEFLIKEFIEKFRKVILLAHFGQSTLNAHTQYNRQFFFDYFREKQRFFAATSPLSLQVFVDMYVEQLSMTELETLILNLYIYTLVSSFFR